MPKANSWVKFTVLLLFLVAALALFAFTPAGDLVAPARLRELIQRLDPLAARVAYVLVYIVGTVLLVPGTAMSFVGAVLFGVWEGTLYTWMGATIGATLAFFVARFLGRQFVDQLLRGRLQALDRRLAEHGFTGLFLLRLVPLFPFNGLNFGSGLTAISTRDYVLATALGILPATFVYQFLFARLGEKVLAEGFTFADLLDPVLGVGLALLIAFIFVGRWLSVKLANQRA